MSARDAESGSSTYKGGSRSAGGLGNGGIGGGMGGGGNWGGGMGGGAGRNGGIGNRTGLTTGNRMYGGMAVGRPGGPAMNPGAWGVAPAAPIGTGPLSGVRRPNASIPVPAAIPGVNPVPEYVPQLPNMWYAPQIPQTPMSIKGPGYKGPTGYWQENPTDYPQWSSGGKLATGNYFSGNTYPGGYNYTDNTGFSFNTIDNIDRNGIDSIARSRGY